MATRANNINVNLSNKSRSFRVWINVYDEIDAMMMKIKINMELTMITMLRQQRQVKKWDENVNTWKSVSAVLCCHCTTFLQWIKLSNE